MRNFLIRVDLALQQRSRWFKWSIRLIWTIVLGMTVGIPAWVSLVMWNPNDLFGGMPSFKDIENPKNDLSSEVISADGVSLGRYFRYNNRSPVSFDELSGDLINTLKISEDHRFTQHSGLDLEAFLRVIKGLLTFDRQGGGSTLSQQTAKNLFNTRDELKGRLATHSELLNILISKTKEWIIAVRLERNFTKAEIMALYLNTVPFNNNAFGIKVAAETYFAKQPSQLNIQESALLVGMLQGTSLYNPRAHPERALRKRNQVIDKLQRLNYVTSEAAADSLKALPLGLNFSIQSHNEGPAQYFRSVLGIEMLKWCKDNGYDLYESGLKIYTTLDSRLQAYAETSLTDHMSRLQGAFEKDWGSRNPWVDDNGNELKDFLQRKIKKSETYRVLKEKYGDQADSISKGLNVKKNMRVFSWNGEHDTLFSSFDSLRYFNRFLHAGLMSMEPHTGAVKAWVGGIDHRYFQYDHVRQSTRQPGSTFKPILYGLAIEDGYSPCHLFLDASPSLEVNGKIYHVKNSNGTYGDGNRYTLRQALAKSLNSISVQLIDRLKPDNVVVFAHKIGIESRLNPVYSLALGTSDVSLFEMVGAYSTFVNLGVHIKPYYITRIEDRNGNVIQTFLPNAKQALDETTAYTMTYMLRGGVEEQGGSSRGLSDAVKSDNEIGGKTGTTDNGSDGWFIGITHDLVTGVWVGGDERSIHFPRWGESSGARAALPIFDKYMTKVYDHRQVGYVKGAFKKPLDFKVNFDCGRYAPQDSTLTIPE